MGVTLANFRNRQKQAVGALYRLGFTVDECVAQTGYKRKRVEALYRFFDPSDDRAWRTWSPSELEYLFENHDKKTYGQIARDLGRTRSSVYSKVKKWVETGVVSRRDPKVYEATEEELAEELRRRGWSLKALSDFPNRAVKSRVCITLERELPNE